MKDNGLQLLLLFAYGPVKKNICASKVFAKKIERCLGGDESLKEEIKQELPSTLNRAWRNLKKIAEEIKKDPLDAEVVSQYVFQIHNEDVMPDCAVHKGLPEVVDMKKRLIYVAAESGQAKKIRFLPLFDDLIGRGKEYYYHHDWLIAIKPPLAKK